MSKLKNIVKNSVKTVRMEDINVSFKMVVKKFSIFPLNIFKNFPAKKSKNVRKK